MSDEKQDLFEKTHRYIKTRDGKVYDEELEYFNVEDRYHVVYTKHLFTDESIPMNAIVEDRTYVPRFTVLLRLLGRSNFIHILTLTALCYYII
jgi:hypothetical protein